MRFYVFTLLSALFLGCNSDVPDTQKSNNPFITKLNKPVDYASVEAEDVKDYAENTLEYVIGLIGEIKSAPPSFHNTISALDDLTNEMVKTSNNCYSLYWVSPDSSTRIEGYAGYQLMDSISNQLFSNRIIFDKIKEVYQSNGFSKLAENKKRLVTNLILMFEQTGVNLEADELKRFKKLNAEITSLSARYSDNMNTANRVLKLDNEGAKGLPENFVKTYRINENLIEIPVMTSTSGPVMGNATKEETRKSFIVEYDNRGSNGNMEILDSLVIKRNEIGTLMGYNSYAEYMLKVKMAENSATVWAFINGLIDAAKPKALQDYERLKQFRNEFTGIISEKEVAHWNIAYYRNQLKKKKYEVDNEKIREYFPLKSCLKGMMHIYQALLNYEFRKVENPSVWHEEVELYEVYENGELRGRFYLDLFPRPNKESWYYGVDLTSGKLKKDGYEVPVSMLLGNFTRPTEDLPSLLSHSELSTLFHEFGHIMDDMAYKGEFSMQSGSKRDFTESMSQIFENWIWDYDILSSFAMHYDTGEILPKSTFDNMVAAKNITSGLSAISNLRLASYDMMLYDKYDPKKPFNSDSIWLQLDRKIGVRKNYINGTHPQASWIHVNGYPVYYYGYIWSDVYAQDMFTEFKKNGLTDTQTGVRYRDLILANGSQRDILESLEEFLGRPSNNKAFIESLGLE